MPPPARPIPAPHPLADDRGQGSVELVALLPLLALLLLALVQATLAGYAAWSAGTAARAGVRAAAVGRDPVVAVRRAAPIGGRDARIRQDGDTLRVRLRVPSVLPVSFGTVGGSAHLESQR
ncbi:TadE/TadG family type IV pilus assembly protein [Patulibacter minatonensis]|uniref:TadE/TadG family type IV pilus assembly protein n=1 Tax=Patulibacter minatonensis TaxID=298163 RepID=UPI00055E4100|nr:TadE/TadG family type IV pilus assembly protein [Patulibacter minatonensis]